MRLIDADALKEIIGECPENWTDSPEEVAEFNMWHRIMNDIDSCQTIGGWISVKDNPPDGECIAYSTKWDEMIIGYIYESKISDTGYEAENEKEFLRDVSHWMPKPERPKKEETN